jgi:putative membrane protein
MIHMMTKPKFLVPLAISLFIAAFFTGTQPLRPEMATVSSIFVILFALPSYWAVISTKGWQRGSIVLLSLGVYALLIESSAIHTGFPYGDFIYNDLLGEKVFGLTPWTVAFAYPPILLLSYWMSRKILTNLADMNGGLSLFLATAGLTALFAMAIDLVLDPAAVALGFWNWESPGFFYEVPLINFLGWLLSGFIGGALLHSLWGKTEPPKALAYSGITILWFWTWINVFQTHVIPAVIGFGLLYVFVRHK